ncbi:unnamed protein product [Ciceribacter sp. T2.26MG-112.2]|nr:unnamed protein product [Ciceribacter naphthalenivorans]
MVSSHSPVGRRHERWRKGVRAFDDAQAAGSDPVTKLAVSHELRQLPHELRQAF